MYSTYKKWEDFEKEIKCNNRYFPKSELLDEIKRIQDYAVCEIDEKDVFYRARLVCLPMEYCKEELEQVSHIIMKYYPKVGIALHMTVIESISQVLNQHMTFQCERYMAWTKHYASKLA